MAPLMSLARATRSQARGFASSRTLAHTFHQNHVLDKYLKVPENKLSMKDLLYFGNALTPAKLLISGNFIRKELPVRLAHRISDFHSLPYIVGTNEFIEKTYLLYWNAFDNLRKFPEIQTLEDNEAYCKLLKESLKTHELVLPTLVFGLHQSTRFFPNDTDADRFFRKMLKSRMGRRILAEQHLKMSDPSTTDGPRGMVSSNIHAGKEVQKCYEAAKRNCMHTFGACPELVLEGALGATFSGFPYHMEYIVYELLKNAMVAVVQKHQSSGAELPPINVCIADSPSRVAVRISDLGGGISHRNMDKLWRFSFSTGPKPSLNDFFTPQMGASLEEQSLKWPMAGTGYGLPISRVFAEHLGGSLELHSIHGFGTDAYVMMKKKPEDQADRVI